MFDEAKKYNERIVLETKKLEKLESKEEYVSLSTVSLGAPGILRVFSCIS